MEKETEQPTSNNTMSYVLGAVLVVAVVAGGYMLRPKTPAEPTPQTADITVVTTPMAPTPTPGPITGLACDYQYYNPVIGFERYFLSVEGGDTSEASEVDCNFTVMQDEEVITTATVKSKLATNAQRGGKTFKCTTGELAIKPTVPTTVNIALTDDKNETATCSAVFALPAP